LIIAFFGTVQYGFDPDKDGMLSEVGDTLVLLKVQDMIMHIKS